MGGFEYLSPLMEGTTPSFTPSLSLANGVAGTSASAEFTIYTYTADGTYVASWQGDNVTVSIPESDEFTPDFQLTFAPYSDYAPLVTNGVYASGMGGVAVSVTGVTPKYGSYVTECEVSSGARSVRDPTDYASSYYLHFPLEKEGNTAVSVSVYDSRGLKKTKTVSLNVEPYGEPTVKDVTMYRCNENGEKSDSGDRLYVKASADFSPLSFGNSCSLKVKLCDREGVTLHTAELTSGEGSVLSSVLSAHSSYTVLIIATDTVGTTGQYRASIPTSRVDFHLNDGRARFGGYCERDGFECDWDAAFGGRVTLGGEELNDYVVESGESGIWTWRKWHSGVAECFGTGEVKRYNVTIPFGSFYVTEYNSTNKNGVEYPTGLFKKEPTVTATPAYMEYPYFIMPLNVGTKERSADYFIIAEHPGTVYAASIAFKAVGKWK